MTGTLVTGETPIPILEKAGARGSFYVISKFATSKKQGYMKLSHLKTLVKNGHGIGSHTKTHLDLTEISLKKTQEEIRGGRKDLLVTGIYPATFAYPYGSQNRAVVKIVRETGFAAARSTIRGYNDHTIDPMLLRCQSVEQETKFEEVRRWIDTTVKLNKWLILMFHRVEPSEILRRDRAKYGTTPAMLKRILNYLSKRKVPTATLLEGLIILRLLRL